MARLEKCRSIEILREALLSLGREKVEITHEIPTDRVLIYFQDSHVGQTLDYSILIREEHNVNGLVDIANDIIRQRDEYIMDEGRRAIKEIAKKRAWRPTEELDECAKEARENA